MSNIDSEAFYFLPDFRPGGGGLPHPGWNPQEAADSEFEEALVKTTTPVKNLPQPMGSRVWYPSGLAWNLEMERTSEAMLPWGYFSRAPPHRNGMEFLIMDVKCRFRQHMANHLQKMAALYHPTNSVCHVLGKSALQFHRILPCSACCS